MKILEEPIISSIVDYFDTNFEQLICNLNEEESFYLFDNDLITSLRKLNLSDLTSIISSLNKSNLIIIPDIVLEESFGNSWMTSELYKAHYEDFFKTLSIHKKIHIISFETLFELVLKASGDEKTAIDLLGKLAVDAMRGHKAIFDSIKTLSFTNKSSLSILEKSLDFRGDNGGERFLTLANLVMINVLYGPGYICSNDKQVSTDRAIHAQNDRLLKRLDLTQENFRKVYQVYSFIKILALTTDDDGFTKEEALQFLKRARKFDQDKKIKAIVYGDWFHDHLTDEQLVDLIFDKKIKIDF